MVSIILPTAGKRKNQLNNQINACLQQTYHDIKLHLVVDTPFDSIYNEIKENEALSRKDNRIEIARVPTGCGGNSGHSAIKWSLANLNLGEWFIVTGDDDVIMPWAVECLIKNSNKVFMVIGKIVPVKRNYDIVRVVLGDYIQEGRITGSCCLFHTKTVRQVGYNDTRYQADWDLIEKMLKFPFKEIDTLLYVMPQSFT